VIDARESALRMDHDRIANCLYRMASYLLKELDARASTACVPKGFVLFRRGETTSAVYVIREGKVALVWAGPDGVHPLDTFGPGSIIGLPAALNGRYSATARAVDDSVLGLIPASRVMEMLDRSPVHTRTVMQLLAFEVVRMHVKPGRPDGNRLYMAEKPED
jgi:CRP-like cAMP-binding protein